MVKYSFMLLMLMCASISSANIKICSGNLKDIVALRDYVGIQFVNQTGNSGTAWCNFSDDGILNKPVIISEGFDFGVASGLSANSTGADLWQLLNINGDLETLRQQGYDFIFLDFDTPLESVQANALVFEELIRKVNKEKVGLFKNIVGGVSMGGLVAKLALTFMEYNGENHDSSLYLSLDSPHGCAHINTDLVQNIQLAADRFDNIRPLWKDVIRSDAALEMLCVKSYDPDEDLLLDFMFWGRANKLREAYRRLRLKYSIRGDGFPDLTRNVAFATGSGYTQGLSPEELLVEFDTTAILSGVSLSIFDIYAYKKPPYDNMPGSTMPWFSLMETILANELSASGINSANVIKIHKTDTSFVPTMSAIGLGPEPMYKYGYEGRSEEYWDIMLESLSQVEYVSPDLDGLSSEESRKLLMRSAYNLFLKLQSSEEAPSAYQWEAYQNGTLPSVELCNEQVDENGAEVTNCYESVDYLFDLTTINNLADHTPFDSVYINTNNDAHNAIPLSFSDPFRKEVIDGTYFKAEVLIPILAIL